MVERTFLLVWHTPSLIKPRQPTFNRMDSLARSIQQAVWLSHGLREDVIVKAYFTDGVLLTLTPRDWRGVHVDERSLLGQLNSAREKRTPGIRYEERSFREVLEGVQPPIFLLEEDGQPLEESMLTHSGTFILGGPLGIPEDLGSFLKEYPRVRVGRKAYLASSVIAHLNILLDEQGE